MTKRNTKDLAELHEIRSRIIDHYVGYNLCRIKWRDKADAERYLMLNSDLDSFTMYGGAPMPPRVEKSVHDGSECWAVVHG